MAVTRYRVRVGEAAAFREQAEAALAALEAELADPQAWNDPRSAARSTRRHADAKARVEALYAELEAVAG